MVWVRWHGVGEGAGEGQLKTVGSRWQGKGTLIDRIEIDTTCVCKHGDRQLKPMGYP